MIRAIVFDFDGVIVESTAIKTRAFGALFADRPEHVDAVVALHLRGVGLSRYDKFELIYRDILREELSEDEVGRLDREFSRLVVEEVLACPFVPGAVAFLEQRSGEQQLFVASATPEAELCGIVEARGLAGWFEGVYGSPKGKPEIVATILAEHALPADEVVVVGDAMSDYDAARANGTRFVGRVPPGEPSPFEGVDVPVVADLVELAREWERMLAPVARR